MRAMIAYTILKRTLRRVRSEDLLREAVERLREEDARVGS